MPLKINQELLFLCSENAREKLRDTAKQLKKSNQRLKYNLRIMEKECLLRLPYTIFDYSYLGLLLFRVYYKGAYISEKDKKDILEKLSENPYIIAMYELGGIFDFVIEFATPNPSRFHKELKNIASLIPTLNNYEITLNVVTHLYPRRYLSKNKIPNAPDEIIIGGDRTPQALMPQEMLVMKQLLLQPKIRYSALAKQTNLNIKTAKKIIKDLEKKKIIKGYKYLPDMSKIGVYQYRLFLMLHNLSNERDKALREYLSQAKEIVQIHKTVGDWDLEVDIEAQDQKKIRQFIISLRENFKDIIEGFNNIEVYHYYKKAYLPTFLFSEDKT